MPEPDAPPLPPFDLGSAALEVFDALPEGVVVLDGGWTVRYANAAALEVLGRPAERVVGSDSRDVDPALLETAFHAAHLRVMRTRVPETVEDRYPTVDRWFRNRVLPCGDGLALLFTEITDAHRARRALLGRLEVLQQVVDHARSGMVLKDLDGRYLLVNRAAAAPTGMEPEQMLGRTAADFHDPELAGRLREHELEVQRTGRAAQREERLAFSPAPPRTFLTLTFPAYDEDGRLVATGAVYTDITERQRVQADLEERQQLQREVFAASSLGQLLMRPDGLVLDVNDSYATMLGYTPEELIGTSVQRLVAPGVPWEERSSRMRNGEVRAYEREEQLLHRDGRLVPVLGTVTVLRDGRGDEPLISIIVRDLSQVRALQERLVSAERMEAVGRLAGGIVHDVNNVLSAVSGYAQLLTSEVEGSERGERLLGGIFRTVERVGDLVSQLLAFARQQHLQPVEQDLCELVLDLEDMLRRLLPEGVRLAIRRSAVTQVRADAPQLQQVLLNLVVNARNALPDGGTITVEIDLVELAGDRDPLPPGRYAQLVVTDDGVGMTPEVASRCFEPFFTTRARSGGHGLGLSTAYGIARQSGGDLRVESAPGAGSRFILLLPPQSAEPEDRP